MPDFASLVRARLGPLAVDPARAEDIILELAQHCADDYEELVASGVGENDAIEQALAPLAGRAAEELASADRPRPVVPAPPASSENLVIGLWHDARYAARVLRQSPAFTAAALITLALGIGANTAIFSVVNGVLLRPLPFADPSRLVQVGEREADGTAGNLGYATFADWRDRAHGFDELAVVRPWTATLVTRDGPERVEGMRVSADFFRMLGAHPAIGRDFRSDEDAPERWRVLILSDGLWRHRFNADPAVVGRTIVMNDQPYQIVGVMPASFEPLISEHFYHRASLWAPLGYDRALPYACRDCQHLKAFGRVKPSMTIEAARADLDAVQSVMRKEHPNEYGPATMTLLPLQDELNRGLRPTILVLMGAVACVLLIACANVANLMLARLAARERDLALRTALGASRLRLVRQLLAESALLALLGGALGAVAAAFAVPLLTRLAPSTVSRLVSARVDGEVLLFTLLLSVVTAILFGLLPALRTSRVDVLPVLHADNRTLAGGARSRARRLLVAFDVALAVVLLSGAALMIKSVGRLVGVDPGFNPDHVLTLQVEFVGKAWAEDPAVAAATDRILDRLRALPGVEAAAAASQIPLGGNGDKWGLSIQGRANPNPAEAPSPERYGVTPEYFSAMRIPLVRGRLFIRADTAASDPVIIIGAETARRLWPGGNPIGEHVRIGDPQHSPWRTIIGIVGDVRHRELAAPPTMQMYTPQAQLTDSYLTLVIRGRGDVTRLASPAREAIWSVAKDVPVSEVAPLEDLVARSVGPRRFVMLLLEAFGFVALLMTAVGVYGVISYSVAGRTRELGIRSALGATRADIIRLVFGNGLAVVAFGLVAGVVLATAATRFLQSSLYSVSATDPPTFAGVVIVLLVVSAAAQLIPVRRATRVDPVVALRQD